MSGKRITFYAFAVLAAALLIGAVVYLYQFFQEERAEQVHFDRDETELVVVNTVGAQLSLFRAGRNLDDVQTVSEFKGDPLWLTKGNYFLQAERDGTKAFYPVPIQGYRSGAEGNGEFAVTIRSMPEPPPTLLPEKNYIYVPSGHFLFGDRLNPREPHLVWTQGFFIDQFEVTNAEFREFIKASDGYNDDSNWTDYGKRWKARFPGTASAKLSAGNAEYVRFGRDDQPVTQVTWFEAIAYCHWLTRKFGIGRWLFSLPTEAEWEKAARGPDNFDYALGQNLSDAETGWYNWKKNPLAEVTVVGAVETVGKYRPNRYGVYHLGGNVVEWTLGTYTPFNRERPYADDERNREDLSGVRVVRGGSWYSASNALLYIPYRDTFQPEISHNDLGFRVVVRNLMQ